jgi:hypothetical protein
MCVEYAGYEHSRLRSHEDIERAFLDLEVSEVERLERTNREWLDLECYKEEEMLMAMSQQMNWLFHGWRWGDDCIRCGFPRWVKAKERDWCMCMWE